MRNHDTTNRRPIDGIWLPLITPFIGGRIDELAFASLVQRYSDASIDGLILAATTGEGLTLDIEETARLVELAAEAPEARLPLYLGLSGSDTRKLVKTLRETEDWAVDGYLIACPYYTRPSQEGLRRHFTALAEESGKPIIVYNIPYRTGVNLSNDTLLRLAELDRIVGVKDCCASHAQSFELLSRRPADFSVMTGEDALFLSALAHGADGGILASAHVDPEGFAAVRRAVLAGEPDAALRRWRDLAEIVTLLFAEPSPAPIKYWLWREGHLPSPEVRLPMTAVSPALAARIDEKIARRTRRYEPAA